MIPVLSKKRWDEWCRENAVALEEYAFVVDTAFYGTGQYSRPGTLFIGKGLIVHRSYELKETVWAIGHKAQVVEIPIHSIREVCRMKLGLSENLTHLYPESCVSITTHEGHKHVLFLQRESLAFEESLKGLGVKIINDIELELDSARKLEDIILDNIVNLILLSFIVLALIFRSCEKQGVFSLKGYLIAKPVQGLEQKSGANTKP